MYQGKNPTALRTQEWLVRSLIHLMKKKTYTSITILDICKEADVSRQTFYNFFSSKEEILHFYLQQQYTTQFSKLKNENIITVEQIIEAFTIVVTENQDLLSIMLKNNLDTILTDEISKCITLFTNQFCNKEEKENILPYAKALLSGAFAHILVFWLTEDHPISIEELSTVFKRFFTGDLYKFC